MRSCLFGNSSNDFGADYVISDYAELKAILVTPRREGLRGSVLARARLAPALPPTLP